jgi:hypothetical protein
MRALILLAFALLFPTAAPAVFDHEHRAWTELLKRHVVVVDGGKASQVRYAGFAKDRAALKAYHETLSHVSPQDYAGWNKAQRLAFLINAYNAFTVEKILTRYPNLKSIRDFGSFIGNPWKDRFFTLLGKPQSLDGIEHDTIRVPGAFDDPRIHFAVNCASVGCPMLREEAYTATRLDALLDEQTLRFLSDRSRNRYNAARGKLEVSSIFDWYGKDFGRGWKGASSVEQFLAAYANRLADAPEQQQRIRDGKAGLKFLDYDWRLNDAGAN